MKPLIKAVSYARSLWPYYVIVTVTSLLVAGGGLAIPFIIKSATDLMVEAISSGDADIAGAVFLAVLLFVVDGLSALVRNVGGYYGDILAARLREQLSSRYYDQLLRLPQSYYDNELTGKIINRLNRAIMEITNFVNVFSNNFFQMIITTVFTLAIVAFYSWQLAIMVFLIYPIFLWLTTLTSKKWQKYQNEKNTVTDIASGRFAEVINQIKVVKSYVKEKLEYRFFEKRFKHTVMLTQEQSRYWHSMDLARGIALSVIFFGIYLFLFTQTVQQKFTIGEMVLLITLISALRFPIFALSFIVDQFQRAITGSVDYVDAMEVEPAITDDKNATTLVVERGNISFSEVNFRYNDSQEVLRDISFEIKSGQKIALVGESGEGKTTLSNLLMRLYEPTSGSIAIDGINIAKVTQESLRKNIATVFQDPALFSGSIRENILYGKSKASDEQMIKAAKAANAHTFIEKLEHSYDSEIGERGLKLSGGQKQRIAIARAILKEAPLLILDEATSSLDSRAEQQVQHALDNLMRGRTTLIIAHRLSTIAHVDMIVTLKNGQIDEIGTPSELAETEGLYSQLLALQTDTRNSAKKRLKLFGIDT